MTSKAPRRRLAKRAHIHLHQHRTSTLSILLLIVVGCTTIGCVRTNQQQRSEKLHPLEASYYSLAMKAHSRGERSKEKRAWRDLLRSFPESRYQRKAQLRLLALSKQSVAIKPAAKPVKQAQVVAKAPKKRQAIKEKPAEPVSRAPVNAKVIGVIYPRSGRGEALGRHIHRSIALAAEKFSNVELVFLDSRSRADVAAKSVDILIERHKAIAIIGPPLRKSAVAAAKRAQARGIPLISITTEKDFAKIGSYVFRNNVTLSMIGRATARYAYGKLGIRRFGMFYPRSRFGRVQAAAFRKEIERLGGKVTSDVSFAPRSKDLRPQLRKLLGDRYTNQHKLRVSRKQMRAMKPYMRRRLRRKLRQMLRPLPSFEGLFVPEDARSGGQIAAYLRLLNMALRAPRERSRYKTLGDGFRGYEKIVMLGNHSWYHKDLFKAGKQYTSGCTFCVRFSPKSKVSRAFIRAYRREYREKPLHIDAYSYDAARMMLSIAKRGDARNRLQFRDAMLRIKQFQGPTGPVSINAQGEAVSSFQCYVARYGYFRNHISLDMP